MCFLKQGAAVWAVQSCALHNFVPNNKQLHCLYRPQFYLLPIHIKVGGNGNPPQHSCLKTLMDRGAWWGIQSMGSQSAGHHRVTERVHTEWLSECTPSDWASAHMRMDSEFHDGTLRAVSSMGAIPDTLEGSHFLLQNFPQRYKQGQSTGSVGNVRQTNKQNLTCGVSC